MTVLDEIVTYIVWFSYCDYMSPKRNRDKDHKLPSIDDDIDMDELSPMSKKDQLKPHEKDRMERMEKYINKYLEKYRSKVESEEIERDYLPNFYADQPFKIAGYFFSNRSVAFTFKAGAQMSEVEIVMGDYDIVREQLEDRTVDYFLGYPPYFSLSSEEAADNARHDAKIDMETAKRHLNLKSMKEYLAGLEKEIQDLARVNPWLKEKADSQTEKLSKSEKIIESLTQEIARQEDEKYSEYLRVLGTLEDIEPMEGEVPEDIEDHIAPPVPIEEERKAPRPAPEVTPFPAKERLEPTVILRKERKHPSVVKVKTELPKEIKDTVFRMNRRLYDVEKKVSPLERYLKANVKNINTKMLQLQARQDKLLKQQREEIRYQRQLLDAAYKKGRAGITLGAISLILLVLFGFYFLYTMGLI